jgi:membrane protein
VRFSRPARAGTRRGVATRLRKFVKLWIDLFAKHELLDHASSVAFQVLKALVPLTLLALAILGAAGEQHVWEKTLLPGIERHVQPATAHAVDVAVEKIFSTNSAGLIAFAALLAAWYLSGAVRGVMTGMNQIYESEETRPWLVRYAVSFGLAVAITACVIGAMIAVLAGPSLARDGALELVVGIGRWIVGVLLLLVAIGMLMRFAPAEPRPKRWAGIGSLMIILAWVAASMIFKVFVTEVANFKTATGSLAVFLVLTGYVYTSSIIFFVGVELDELFREDAAPGQRGVLELLGIAR